MSDRRPEPIEHDHGMHASDMAYEKRQKDAADLIAVVRRGVESGTIKGEMVRVVFDSYAGYGFVGSDGRMVDLDDGTYIVIGPVSDGGSET